MKARVDPGRCTGCGSCVAICPFNLIRLENGVAVIGSECAGCGVCSPECPTQAIVVE